MAVTTTKTNKPLNPRGNDQSPKGYNRAALYSGKALDFDGVNDTLKGSEPFSYTNHAISANFSTSSASSYKIIFDGRDGGADGPLITIEPGNRLKYQINGVATTEYIVTADEWYNVVGVYDGTNQSIYINGQLWETKTNSGSVSVTTNWSVGVRSFSTEAAWFDGMIGGVKAYSTALTAAQVADLYNNPEKIVPTGVSNDALKLWLPMQEGAGTTAYDGSGNGNHGTISGATYTHGIGAPVSQTAVIDWNKGTNKIINSVNLSSFSLNEVTIDSGYSAPDGSNTAFKITKNSGATSPYAVQSAVVEGDDYRAIYARTTSGTGIANLLAYGANTNNLFTITEEWQKFSIDAVTTSTAETNFYLIDFRFSTSLDEIIVWAPHCADSESVYIPTFATGQTSPVLLPQGLTSGRDITGVNLFENVRKQGALNLDGKSWAEVHDNASLDFGAGSLTLEAWAKVKYVNNGSALNVVMTLGGNMSSAGAVGMHISSSLKGTGVYNNSYTNSVTTLTTGDWVHLVSVYDGTNNIVYINGSADNSLARTAVDITNALVKQIGRDSSTTRYYHDQIAQPRIYNRALTAEEVARNYNAGKNIFTND